jgi:hypothetical protein
MTDEQMKKLREPFSPKQISQRPKPTSAQNTCPPNEKINCTLCGGWHHSKVQHLSYVGHGAVTHRLLEVDPVWNWDPLAIDDNGLPRFDETGGLWIKLTICGHTRLGYGHAVFNKFAETGSREKEVIGDAIRNAAMRFGVALDLWSKANLESTDDNEPAQKPAAKPDKHGTPNPPIDYFALIEDSKTLSELTSVWKQIPAPMKPTYMKVKDAQKESITNLLGG